MATGKKKTVDQRSFRRRQNVYSPVAASECAALCFSSSTSKEKTREVLALAERAEGERQSKGLGNRGIFKQPPIFVFFSGRTYYLVTSSGKTSFPLLPRSRASPPPRTRSLPLPTESPPTPCPSASAPPPRTAKSSSSSSRPSPAPTPSGEASPTASRPSRGSRGRPRR